MRRCVELDVYKICERYGMSLETVGVVNIVLFYADIAIRIQRKFQSYVFEGL